MDFALNKIFRGRNDLAFDARSVCLSFFFSLSHISCISEIGHFVVMRIHTHTHTHTHRTDIRLER